MPFSVGGHPGFNCPLVPDKKFTDYRLEFEKPETLLRRIKRDGLLCGESRVFLDDQAEKELTHGLFYDDAVILRDLASSWVELSAGEESRSVRVDFTASPTWASGPAATTAPTSASSPGSAWTPPRATPAPMEEKEGIRILPGRRHL